MKGDGTVEQAVAVTDEESKADSHPILGDLLRDLSYKKVYVTSVSSLVKVPIWERQRTLRADRAREIANDWTQRKVGGKVLSSRVVYRENCISFRRAYLTAV